MTEVKSLAHLMFFLEQSINQNAKGDKLWLEEQNEVTQKEWQGYAKPIIRLWDREDEDARTKGR